MLIRPEVLSHGQGEPPPQMMGWFFTLFAGVWMATGHAVALSTTMAGRYLQRPRRGLFCLITAGIMAATFMPFGTVLGVFTIIVLMRPSVKAGFLE